MSAPDAGTPRWRRAAGPRRSPWRSASVVAAAVEVAILAVVAQGGVEPDHRRCRRSCWRPLGYLLLATSSATSSNITTKVVLSVGLLAAFVAFSAEREARRSVDQARLPLASLFLWVQVLHAFDVPRRRDLAFSMVSSVILMAEAGVALALPPSCCSSCRGRS